jgi:excisionase family DNA binding protein
VSVDRLLTAREVGERLAVGERYVWWLAREGALPRVEIGKYVRFHESDIAAFIKARTTRPTSGSPVAHGPTATVTRRRFRTR